MKKLLLVFAIIPSLFAIDPACLREEYGDQYPLTVSGEWLYFMPSFDQSEWVWLGSSTASSAASQSYRQGEKQRYYSAFRIDANFLFPDQCHEFIMRYTNFRANPHEFFNAPVASEIFGIAEDTDSLADAALSCDFNRNYNYYSIEGLFGPQLPDWACFESFASFGVKFVHLSIKEFVGLAVQDDTITDYIRNTMKAWALGPIINFETAYPISCQIKALVRLTGGLLACHTNTTLGHEHFFDQASVTVKNSPSLWHVVPSADFRLGLASDCEFCLGGFLFRADLQGGYEFLREARMVNRIQTLNGVQTGYSLNEWSDFTLNGPFVRFGLSY